MKRPAKHKSDIDLRGRVRRHPQVEADPRPPVKARFVDGPLAGQLLDAPRDADYIHIGPWTYSWCGKDDQKRPQYAKVPKSRLSRRLLRVTIEKRGVDPRAVMSEMRAKPATRTTPPARGRGKRRREAARAHNGT